MDYAISQSYQSRPRRPRLPSIRRVVQRPQTYRNILYLLASFPLGLCYFIFLITALSIGVSTLIVWIGIPILLLTVGAWWGLAAFERGLAIWWLGVTIPPMARPRAAGMGPGGRLKAHLGNQVTWTSLVYLLVKFPLGVVSFGLTIGLVALTAKLLTAPAPHLLDAAVGNQPGPFTLALAFGQSLLGIVVGLLSLYLLNGLAFVSGRFARLMLGLSDTAVRLSETRALAERERAKAERAEQSRRELIVNVGHELRTPIASIRGHVDTLLMAAEGGGPAPTGRRPAGRPRPSCATTSASSPARPTASARWSTICWRWRGRRRTSCGSTSRRSRSARWSRRSTRRSRRWPAASARSPSCARCRPGCRRSSPTASGSCRCCSTWCATRSPTRRRAASSRSRSRRRTPAGSR